MAPQTKRKKRREAKPKFSKKTRLFDLVRREHHGALKSFVCQISVCLKDCEAADWKNLAMLNVDFAICRKSDLIFRLAEFLFSIGKSEGLKCSLRGFCQYLSKSEHSNLGLTEGSLTQIIRMLSYIEEREKNDKKW